MEIKHTVEILTKDIQDIEKLVRNLNNYQVPPQIEIDLAMSKLRNVYELLAIISRDMKTDRLEAERAAGDSGSGGNIGQPGEREQVPFREHIPTEQTQQETTPQHQDILNTEQTAKDPGQPPVQQPEAQPTPTQKQRPADSSRSSFDNGSKVGNGSTEGGGLSTGTGSTNGDGSAPGTGSTQAKAATESNETDRKRKEEAKKSSILAEKFASDKSLNEKIAPGSKADLSSKLTGEPIESIKRNIGINDRFLIIRELMEGNNEAFNDLVQQLDTKNNFDEAYSIIQSNFADQMEHEGVNILLRLSRRRYLNK